MYRNELHISYSIYSSMNRDHGGVGSLSRLGVRSGGAVERAASDALRVQRNEARFDLALVGTAVVDSDAGGAETGASSPFSTLDASAAAPSATLLFPLKPEKRAKRLGLEGRGAVAGRASAERWLPHEDVLSSGNMMSSSH